MFSSKADRKHIAGQFNIFLSEIDKGCYRSMNHALKESGAEITCFKLFMLFLKNDNIIYKDKGGFYQTTDRKYKMDEETVDHYIRLRYQYVNNHKVKSKEKRVNQLKNFESFIDILPKHTIPYGETNKRVVFMEDIMSNLDKFLNTSKNGKNNKGACHQSV